MKILFIVPPVSMEERYGKLSKVGSIYPPLGLAYIAAVAEKRGHDVKIIDTAVSNMDMEGIEKNIIQFKPDMIGMQTYFTTIARCYAVAACAKKISKNIKVILGGAQCTHFPNESLSREDVDYVFRGESEIAFDEFLQAFENGTGFEKIKGLCWKNQSEIIISDPAPLIENLDDIPVPAWHLFQMELYHSAADHRGKKVFHMVTSRGCPYRCSFCAVHLSFGRTFRYHSAERVLKEINILIEKYGADEVHFFDDVFTCNRQRVIELCKKMSDNLKINWTCETRVNRVDADLLMEMNKAGCYKISFGVESGVPRLLKLIKKDITLEQCIQAFRNAKKAGMETMGLFMLALPSETKEESMETIDFAIKLKPDFVQFAITAPYPGTDLDGIARQYGTIITPDYSKYTSWEVVYVPTGREKEEISSTVSYAYRRFYLRPGYIIRRLIGLRKYNFKNIWRMFSAAMKIFFK